MIYKSTVTGGFMTGIIFYACLMMADHHGSVHKLRGHISKRSMPRQVCKITYYVLTFTFINVLFTAFLFYFWWTLLAFLTLSNLISF